jgi:predicted 3-demethylubiquinone-9 3-methyltransferase (glyoxalase superfamily)
MQKIRTFLWFDDNAEQAVEHYTAVFPNSSIQEVSRYTEAGPGDAGQVSVITFTLAGQEFMALKGGPEYTFTEAVSLLVLAESQEEVDEFWAKLADGGEEGPCGWLKDRFGLSWQVMPIRMEEMLADPNPDKVRRATEAMLRMQKFDIAKLEAAFAGTG